MRGDRGGKEGRDGKGKRGKGGQHGFELCNTNSLLTRLKFLWLGWVMKNCNSVIGKR